MKKHKRGRRRGSARSGSVYRWKRFLSLIVLLASIATFIDSGLYAEDRVAEGAKDIAKGTTAVPSKIAETANESNILYGLTVGTAEGLLDTAKGIGEGIFKILTFYSEND